LFLGLPQDPRREKEPKSRDTSPPLGKGRGKKRVVERPATREKWEKQKVINSHRLILY